jgi:periplasmic divalent cation tolerance protein
MMPAKNDYAVVLVTAKDSAEAQKIANALLEKKLIACANLISGVQSLFWWEGKIDQAQEVLLVLKTKVSQVSEITKNVKALHSYDVPEVIALPIVAGNEDYLKWIKDSVQ